MTFVEGFPEVEPRLVDRCVWQKIYAGRWERRENINELEGRAVLWGIRRLANNLGLHGFCALLLSDNLGVCFSLGQARRSSFEMLKIWRRVEAKCLAA